MSVRVRISDGPLAPRPARPAAGGVGAVLVFEGVVREREGDGTVEALDYQAYEPMAASMLERIAESLVRGHRLSGIEVEHSRGRVPVGGVSFRLVIESVHRREGLLAADDFINRLKQDVPIWKRPLWRTPSRPAPVSTP